MHPRAVGVRARLGRVAIAIESDALDRAKLGKTKPGVIVVNTARAGVVDEAALIEFLRSGHVGHYATDVFAQEPVPPHEPLLALDNVTLTAHAGYNTPEAAMTMYRRAIDLAAAG